VVADLDPRLLRAFVAVAEELSFSRAAERVGLAQQALSAQVRQLEGRLDVKLFKRTTRRVTPTPAGEALLPHARAALAAGDAGVEAVRRTVADAANAIAVAGVDEAGAVGTEILERFARDFPEIAVSVSDRMPPQVLLEESGGPPPAVAFVRPPFRGVNRFSTVTLLAEPRVVALPASHSLADRERVEPSELMAETWAWLGSTDRVAESFWLLEDHRYGRPPRIGGHPRSWEDLLVLVAAEQAIGIVPASIAATLGPAAPKVRFVAVDGIEPSPLVLAWRPGAETPAVRELAEVARVMARQAGSATV
ncbi:MAG TPA: LysR family transcriptional regulator, partial [Thermoleophilaceae bacterium]|nr:LysR family transcriptional regulator [Thermoleophilaceae bacterium]